MKRIKLAGPSKGPSVVRATPPRVEGPGGGAPVLSNPLLGRIRKAKAAPALPANQLVLKEHHAQIGQSRPTRVAAKHPDYQVQLADKQLANRKIADTLEAKANEKAGGGGLSPASIVADVRKELEGTGAVEGVIHGVANYVASHVNPNGAFPSTVRTDVGTKLAQNAARDAINLPAEVVPSVYHLASEAVQVRPRSDGKLLGPPLQVTVSGKGTEQAAKDLAAPFVVTAKHPVKSFENHPLDTALIASGAKSLVGNTLGRTMRALPSETTRRLASTERAPATVPGTNLAEKRTYSHDPLTKAAQAAGERVTARKITKLQKKADQLDQRNASNPHYDDAKARELRARAVRLAPTRLPEAVIKTRVNEIDNVSEVLRRRHAAEVDRSVKHAARNTQPLSGGPLNRTLTALDNLREGVGKAAPAVPLVAQNIAHATVEDLKAYRDQALREFNSGHLDAAQEQANKRLRAQLSKGIAHPAELASVKDAARRYAEVIKPIEDKLIGHGILDREQALRAKVIPYAVAKMGAYDTERGAAKAETAMRQSRANLDQVRRAQKAAQKEHAAAVAQANVAQGRAEVLSRNVGGRPAENAATSSQALFRLAQSRAGKAARPTDVLRHISNVEQRASRYAGGGYGVQATRQAVDSAARKLEAANAALKDAQASHERTKAAAASLRKHPLTTMDGKPLPTEVVIAHMRANGHDMPAFVSHKPNLTTAGSFYRHFFGGVKLGSGRRTGASVAKGTLDISPDVLRANARRMQTLVDAGDSWNRFLNVTALRNARGKVRQFGSRSQGEQALKALHAANPGSHEFTLVPALPFASKKVQLEHLIDAVNADDAPRVWDALEAAAKGEGEERGQWVAIPKVAADHMHQHLRVLNAGSAGKGLNWLNSQFRRTVLTTSTKWATGNVVEAALRAGIKGAGPGSRALYRRTLAEIRKTNPALADEIDAATIGHGGHFGLAETAKNHTVAEDFMDSGPTVRRIAGILGTASRSTPGRVIGGVWRAWTENVLHQMAHVEAQFKQALAGKYIKQNLIHDEPLHKLSLGLSEKAIEQAANGLHNTPEQVALARYVRRAYGQYEAFGPQARRIIALYTPFVAWSLNAVRFLTSVLPKDHPVLTALLASADQASEEWRKQHGLEEFMQGAVPGFLQGSIPTKNGGHMRLSRYTPFGIAGDPADSVGSVLIPQWRGMQNATQGNDPFGNKLKKGTTKGEALISAALSSFVPLAGQTSRIVGGKGTVGQRLNKEFNPFAPVQRKQASGGGTSSGLPQSLIDSIASAQGGSSALPQSLIDSIGREQGTSSGLPQSLIDSVGAAQGR